MTGESVHGPVDFVLIEFPDDHLTGRAAAEVVDLVRRGIVRIYDVLVVGKNAAGDTYALDLAEVAAERLGGFQDLAWARTGLLGDDDLAEAASVLEPGRLAVLLVYENLWAVPFVAAARESGGELVAGARIPAQDVMDALDALEAIEPLESLETTS
jgi:hypothetical protein